MKQLYLTKLQRIWQHINFRRRLQLAALFILMMFTSFAEVISIGAVLPFLGVITAPEKVMGHHMMEPIIQFLGIVEPKQLLLLLTIVFAIKLSTFKIFQWLSIPITFFVLNCI